MRQVNGWLTERERLALRKLAFGKKVLEIGCYEGLSTVCMAATARIVFTVDPMDGRATPEPRDTEATLNQNLQDCGVEKKVITFKGTSEEICPTIKEKFGLVFIDADHSYEAVKRDYELIQPLLEEGATVAFHDYCEQHPGVRQFVDELIEQGATPVSQNDTLVELSPKKLPVNPTVVYLGMPHRNCEVHLGSAMAFLRESTKRKMDVISGNFGTSLLTLTFNTLWCEALNLKQEHGITHFAMLHNDIIPSSGWLDTLLDEMNSTGADLVSAVVPLKSPKGLTSTGIGSPSPWSVRRLSMHELFELPETFTAMDLPAHLRGSDGAPLLANTGCWVMKFDQPWCSGLHFRMHDEIFWADDMQKYVAKNISEDWDFSQQVHSRGGLIACTRKVKLIHERPEYHNRHPWGTWETDQDFRMIPVKQIEKEAQAAIPLPVDAVEREAQAA